MGHIHILVACKLLCKTKSCDKMFDILYYQTLYDFFPKSTKVFPSWINYAHKSDFVNDIVTESPILTIFWIQFITGNHWENYYYEY